MFYLNLAMATLLSGLGNDGRRKRLKLQLQSFKPPLPKAARPLPILHRVLVLPKLSFNEFIRHQVQALIVWFFIIKNKEQALRRLAEAGQSDRFKVVARRYDENLENSEVFKYKVLNQVQEDDRCNPLFIPMRYSNLAITTLLSGLGNDGRRKRLKLRLQSFKPPLPKAARPLPILHRVLVLPKLSFNEFIRHQVQALIFLLLF